MSGFLDPKPVTVHGLDAATATKINTPASATATALAATIDTKVTEGAAAVVAPKPGLRPFFAKLAQRDTTPVRIMFGPGDSHTAGEGATVSTRRWQARLSTRIASRLGISTGNFWPAASGGVVSFPYPVANSGASRRVDFGLGQRAVEIPAGSGTSTFTFTALGGAPVGIRYLKNPGNGGIISIAIDGGAPTTIDTGAAGGGMVDGTLWIGPVLAAGSHTVVVTNTHATKAIYIDGYHDNATASIQLLDGSAYGTATNNWTGGNGYAAIAGFAPDVAVVALGTNDQAFPGSIPFTLTPAVYQANIVTILEKLRTAKPNLPALLVAMPARNLALWPADQRAAMSPWSAYIDAMKSVADADPLAEFLDLAPWVGQAEGDTLGLFTDGVHMSDAGHALVADAMAGALLPY